jgi:hypothetical protein
VNINGLPFVAVSVDAGCQARAFICLDPETGFVDCVQRVSSITETVHYTGDDSDRVRLSVPLDGLGLPHATEIVTSGGTLTTDSDITWVESDADNYVFTWISGVRIRLWWWDGFSFFDHILNSGDPVFTLTATTQIWGVDNWENPIGNVDNPFEVEICPPEPA